MKNLFFFAISLLIVGCSPNEDFFNNLPEGWYNDIPTISEVDKFCKEHPDFIIKYDECKIADNKAFVDFKTSKLVKEYRLQQLK